MPLVATRAQFHAISGHWGTIYMRLADSGMQTLHALASSCMQSRLFFASTLQEQLFKLKMKMPLKNLRIYATHVLANINTMHYPIQSRETVPLKQLNK
jgi:hypothetical protein